MNVFKFRTIDNFHFIIDIIFNKRLYCCKIKDLNDIREADLRWGIYDSGPSGEGNKLAREILQQGREYRICSLSKSFDNHLLWAHYAGGYTGIAIEVEVEDNDIHKVAYSDDCLYYSDLLKERIPADEALTRILSRKYLIWSYENELRIITKEEYYPVKYISRIVVGARTIVNDLN